MTGTATRYDFNTTGKTSASDFVRTRFDARNEFNPALTTDSTANGLLRCPAIAGRHPRQHTFVIEERLLSIASGTADEDGQPKRRIDQFVVLHGKSGFSPYPRDASPEKASTTRDDARPSGQPKDVCATWTAQCAVGHLATRPLRLENGQGRIRFEISKKFEVHDPKSTAFRGLMILAWR